MSDGFPDRLTQLRARWQGDPSSRVFLQLAEEYRHLGRVQEALAVLESGLKEHPGYLSALVAKGRCLLELGDPEQARGVLERVVQQDATQMVANKLLVRAYLETSDPERARQRLDLYSLLNDSDPEIEELRRRVVALSRPRRAPDEPRSDEPPPERSRMEPTETPESEVFDLEPAVPSHAAAAEPGEDIFGLGDLPELPPAPSATATPTPSVPPPATVSAPLAAVFTLPAAVPAPPAAVPEPPAAVPAPPPPEVALAPPALLPRGESNGAEPFPDPTPEDSRRLYLAAFEAEQIFAFEAGRPETASAGADVAPPAAASAAAPPEPAATVAAPPGPAAPTAVPGAPAAAAAATIAVPVSLAAPAPTPDTPAPATVTLGELYLRQGHRQEAERIFRLVAEREPDNAAARAALGRLAGLVEVAEQAEAAQQPEAAGQPEAAEQAGAVQQPEAAGPPLQAVRPDHRPLDAAQLLAGLENPQAPVSLRKAYLLRRYLTRLRQARSPHVP